MKIVNQHSPIQRLTKIAFALLFVFSISLSAQDATNGKKIFKANCTACHKLDKKLVGPPLKNISEKRDNKWLKSWIKNSAAFIKSGDKDAIAIFEEYNKMPMMTFPQLSDKDIDDMIAYMDGKEKKKEATPVGKSGTVDPKVAEGKKLFKTNCSACHKMEGKLVGPPLKGITEKREREWLHAWIKDNNALRKSGDALANQVFEENNKMPMTAFPQLSESKIDAMLAYFKVGDVKKVVASSEVKQDENKNEGKESSSDWMSWIVILLVLVLVVLAFRSKVTFVKIVALIFMLLLGAYYTFDALMAVGIDQGYEPIQPIAFSHKIHAGDNKIDCQYCHSSAKHSKTSGIPSASVCMNCHKSISEVADDTRVGELGKKELDLEIQKIYNAVGWDSENFKYKENYQKQPIEWTRVHNLPDFVYYNHSQHVTVAGLDCQKCHGPVEEMDEMRQHSPLTMRWCLDCHKDTDVNMDNKYYTKIHEELKKTGIDKATIGDLGGKECGKCHY